jgi:hypothetical protein
VLWVELDGGVSTVFEIDERDKGGIVMGDDVDDTAASYGVVGVGPVEGENDNVCWVRGKGRVDGVSNVVRSPTNPDAKLFWCHVRPFVRELAEDNIACEAHPDLSHGNGAYSVGAGLVKCDAFGVHQFGHARDGEGK